VDVYRPAVGVELEAGAVDVDLLSVGERRERREEGVMKVESFFAPPRTFFGLRKRRRKTRKTQKTQRKLKGEKSLTLPLVSSMIAQSFRVRAMASARLASEARWKSREPHWYNVFFFRSQEVSLRFFFEEFRRKTKFLTELCFP
jgi:hypothetical protein